MIRRPILAALGLLIATSAQAAPVVNTPPLPSGISGASFASCLAANTGSKAANVTVDIIDLSDGSVVATSGPVTVAPRESKNVSLAGSGSYNKYCRVTGLSKAKVTVLFAEVNASTELVAIVTAP